MGKGLTDIPTEILHNIAKGEIRTTLRLSQVSKTLSKMINIENTTIMDFSSASDQFRVAYYTKLLELGVDIYSKQPSKRLAELYIVLDKVVQQNSKILQSPCFDPHYPALVLRSYYKRKKQQYVEFNDKKTLPERIDADYYKELEVYDELIGIYLQICNFKKAHMHDLIELRNLYYYKLYTILKILQKIQPSVKAQIKMRAIEKNCAYIYYELTKMCLTIVLKKGSFKETDYSRYLMDHIDYTLYYRSGMAGYMTSVPEMEFFNKYIYYSIYAKSQLDTYLIKIKSKALPFRLDEEGALQKVIEYVINHKTILIKSHKKIIF
jgi:hypothetical protein